MDANEASIHYQKGYLTGHAAGKQDGHAEGWREGYSQGMMERDALAIANSELRSQLRAIRQGREQ